MKYLIESFYHSIVQRTPLPIPYREILLTTRIMDAIFDQLGVSRPGPHFGSEMPSHIRLGR